MTRRSASTLLRRLAALAVVVPTLVALHASTALAAGQLGEVDGEFGTADSDADVTLDYVVTAGEAAVDTIPLTALHFGGVTIDGLEAVTSDGASMDVSTDVGSDKTTVELTPEAPIQPGDELQFSVSYQAVQAVTARDSDDANLIEIPVLAVTWAPAESRGGVFTGQLTLPDGYHFAEGFPSVPESIDEVGSREVVTFDMSVMPAVIAAVAGLYYGTVIRPRKNRSDEPAAVRVDA